MNWLLMTAISLLLVYPLRFFLPVKGLRYIGIADIEVWSQQYPRVTIVDIRESVDYLKGHVPGSVSMYLGRLPYVWNKTISSGDQVLIVGSNKAAIRKAARLLHRYGGFTELHAALYPTVCSESKVIYGSPAAAAFICCCPDKR
jgi:rhodanese-related sulfurtransferase